MKQGNAGLLKKVCNSEMIKKSFVKLKAFSNYNISFEYRLLEPCLSQKTLSYALSSLKPACALCCAVGFENV